MELSLLLVVKCTTVELLKQQWLYISVIQDTFFLGMFIVFVRVMAIGVVQYLIVIRYLVSTAYKYY